MSKYDWQERIAEDLIRVVGESGLILGMAALGTVAGGVTGVALLPLLRRPRGGP